MFWYRSFFQELVICHYLASPKATYIIFQERKFLVKVAMTLQSPLKSIFYNNCECESIVSSVTRDSLTVNSLIEVSRLLLLNAYVSWHFISEWGFLISSFMMTIVSSILIDSRL